ncbi:hypothetical protein PoB_003331800 [Plakobranchus ocellatus]|uniref:Uncharacterized protein n=1 Tax=Plakobranchus ocellatus TaxID=259542 RepID=A0AAV4AJ53_9GAST|nr:hypothetical protein PoB_003331800 [Plakobranchus ocellatus]
MHQNKPITTGLAAGQLCERRRHKISRERFFHPLTCSLSVAKSHCVSLAVLKLNSQSSVCARASVAQLLASPPYDLEGPFCRGFLSRHWRPGQAEGLKA